MEKINITLDLIDDVKKLTNSITTSIINLTDLEFKYILKDQLKNDDEVTHTSLKNDIRVVYEALSRCKDNNRYIRLICRYFNITKYFITDFSLLIEYLIKTNKEDFYSIYSVSCFGYAYRVTELITSYPQYMCHCKEEDLYDLEVFDWGYILSLDSSLIDLYNKYNENRCCEFDRILTNLKAENKKLDVQGYKYLYDNLKKDSDSNLERDQLLSIIDFPMYAKELKQIYEIDIELSFYEEISCYKSLDETIHENQNDAVLSSIDFLSKKIKEKRVRENFSEQERKIIDKYLRQL